MWLRLPPPAPHIPPPPSSEPPRARAHGARAHGDGARAGHFALQHCIIINDIACRANFQGEGEDRGPVLLTRHGTSAQDAGAGRAAARSNQRHQQRAIGRRKREAAHTVHRCASASSATHADSHPPSPAAHRPGAAARTVADDHGFHDCSFTGSKVQTPTIDHLRASGIALEQH